MEDSSMKNRLISKYDTLHQKQAKLPVKYPLKKSGENAIWYFTGVWSEDPNGTSPKSFLSTKNGYQNRRFPINQNTGSNNTNHQYEIALLFRFSISSVLS